MFLKEGWGRYAKTAGERGRAGKSGDDLVSVSVSVWIRNELFLSIVILIFLMYLFSEVFRPTCTILSYFKTAREGTQEPKTR